MTFTDERGAERVSTTGTMETPQPTSTGSRAGDPITVDGLDRPQRMLTVDFAAFTQKLLEEPELDQCKLSFYIAGVDLIEGLSGPPDASFKSAAPGMTRDAELSEQLAAITDEALRAAEEILEAAHTREDPVVVGEHFDLRGPVSRELAFALSRLGHSEYSAAHTELVRARPSPDRAVAGEFI